MQKKLQPDLNHRFRCFNMHKIVAIIFTAPLTMQQDKKLCLTLMELQQIFRTFRLNGFGLRHKNGVALFLQDPQGCRLTLKCINLDCMFRDVGKETD